MITALYASILALFYVLLSALVIKGRYKANVTLGFGTSRMLEQRIRAHGNFSEYTPIALILMILFELQGHNLWLLHAFGILFFIGRLLHLYGIVYSEKYDGEKLLTSFRFRRDGMVCTFLTIISLAMANIIAFIASFS